MFHFILLSCTFALIIVLIAHQKCTSPVKWSSFGTVLQHSPQLPIIQRFSLDICFNLQIFSTGIKSRLGIAMGHHFLATSKTSFRFVCLFLTDAD
jgi:hypothetical protein